MTNLEKAFRIFTTTNGLRPLFDAPFEHDIYVYATDAYSLIRVNKSEIDFDVNNPHDVNINFAKVFPNANMREVSKIDFTIFDVYKTQDEKIKIADAIGCRECGGSGEVSWRYDVYTKDFDCPVCHGEGNESEAQYKKTGKKHLKITVLLYN